MDVINYQLMLTRIHDELKEKSFALKHYCRQYYFIDVLVATIDGWKCPHSDYEILDSAYPVKYTTVDSSMNQN